MEQSKKEFLSVLQGVKLTKTQNPTMAEKIEKEWKVIPYASVIGSIKYAMYQTYCIPCSEFGKGVQ